MTNREAGINVVREMMGDRAAAKLNASADSNTFGAPIAVYSVDQVFADIWTRPGLDRRSRSLVSMSVMIAMRQPHGTLITPVSLDAVPLLIELNSKDHPSPVDLAGSLG